MNRPDALNLLGLNDPVCETDIKAAFRQKAKAAHPDHGAKTADDLHHLLRARDLLIQTFENTNQITDKVRQIHTLKITPHQAIHGGEIIRDTDVNIDVIENDHLVQSLNRPHRLHIHLPGGLRPGETLRLKTGTTPGSSSGLMFRIEIEPDNDLSVTGDDIWMSAAIDPQVFRFGGEAVIKTPHGPHSAHIVGPFEKGSCLRLKGLGLPARDHHPAGHLYVRLEAADMPVRPASELLAAFAQRWA